MKTAIISTTAPGDSTIIAAISEKRIRVLAYTLSISSNSHIRWKSGATPISGEMHMSGGSSIAIHLGDQWPGGGLPVLVTEPGEALVLNVGGAVTVGGHLTYVESLV